ncbi:three component ABC system middle component [Pseudomonas cremoricolorata]|uniref:three component ABC system middle component n=1 Tax=Pseudomonas cremoricolorata TaxID=157783 RepID=UPI0012B52658|nr:three component ABC system middle component [Pseudomonas cremoricolorata]
MEEIIRPKQDFREIYLMQNPAIGAALIWRFTEGYAPKGQGQLPTMLLLFIVLPILFHEQLRNAAITTNPSSGLRVFAGKFKSEQEILFGIQGRMLKLRDVSLASISIAIQSNLISLNTSDAHVESLRPKAPADLQKKTADMMKAAQKLGHWCKTLTLQEVQAILRIKL